MSCFTVTEMFSSLYFSHERAAGRLLKPCVTLLTFPGVFTADNLSVQTQTLIESTVVTGLLASDLKPEREQLFLYVCVTEVGGHRDELLSLLTQSSLLLVSPLATVPQVRLFFLRWDTGSPSEPEAASESESEELEEDDEDESLELSEAMPVDSCRSTLSASTAMSGRSCFKIRYHFLDSLGRPRTVLCHTMGKLVVLAKF